MFSLILRATAVLRRYLLVILDTSFRPLHPIFLKRRGTMADLS